MRNQFFPGTPDVDGRPQAAFSFQWLRRHSSPLHVQRCRFAIRDKALILATFLCGAHTATGSAPRMRSVVCSRGAPARPPPDLHPSTQFAHVMCDMHNDAHNVRMPRVGRSRASPVPFPVSIPRPVADPALDRPGPGARDARYTRRTARRCTQKEGAITHVMVRRACDAASACATIRVAAGTLSRRASTGAVDTPMPP